MAKFLRQFEAPLGFKLTLIGAKHSGEHSWACSAASSLAHVLQG